MDFNRRNVLIGLGGIAAGAGTLAGTGAFSSVTAERSADVNVAGDAKAFLGVLPADSANAEKYVSTTDGNLALDLDGDSGASGSGVNDNAITQVEDLFKIVNQGTQAVNVYFEDDSDAVTFRVARSTDTSTNGTSGQTLEGPDNSINLGIGEQVVVGLTVDTLNNDVDGQLVDDVTITAEAGPAAPGQSGPAPEYVVAPGDAGGPNTFDTISAALNAAEPGAVIGIRGDVGSSPLTVDSPIDIELDDVTVTGFEGRPTIDRDVQDGPFIEASGDGVTIRNLEITEDVTGGGFGGERSILASGSGVTIDGVTVENQDSGSPKGNPTIATVGEDTTITNCESINAPIAANGASGSLTLTNNYVEDALTEGIFTFGSTAGELDLTVENNYVDNHDINDVNAKEIKIVDEPASVNGETDKTAQIESLLTENSVNSVQLNGDSGTLATPDNVGSGKQFASVNEVLQPSVKDSKGDVGTPAGSGLVALFEDGEYDSFEEPVELSRANAVIKGLSRPRLNYDGGYPGGGLTFSADGISVENIEVDFFGASDEPSKDNFSGGSGLIDTGSSDVTFRNAALNVVFVEEDGSVTFDTKGGLGVGSTPGASFINVDVGILNRQAGRPISLDRGRPGGFFIIGQEIRDCTLRGGPKIATGSVTDPTVVDNTITDVANSESLAIDSSATSAVVRGNSIEYDPSDSRIGKAFGGAEIRMESSTTDVNGQNLADAQAVADELSEANSGSQLVSGNAVVVNRSTDPNTRSP